MKVILTLMLSMFATFAMAQKIYVQPEFALSKTAHTNVGSVSSEKQLYTGADVGYYLQDNLAVFAGVGFSDANRTFTRKSEFRNEYTAFTFGVRYEFTKKVGIVADWNGGLSKGKPSYVGVQPYISFPVAKQISVEPFVRYDFATNNKFDNKFGYGLGLKYDIKL